MAKRKIIPRKERQRIVDIQLAESRIGDTPELRLKWILDFKDQSLSNLSSGERAMLGFSLRALVDKGMTSTVLADAVLSDLQEWVANLFKALSSKPKRSSSQVSPAISVPAPKSFTLSRISPLASKKARFFWYPQFDSYTNKSLQIKYVIAEVLRLGSEKLRFCLRCRAPFVAHRKQTYCSTKCSQRSRDIKRGKSFE